MKLGNFKFFFWCLLLILTNTFFVLAEDKIEVVPLINLEELSPTFEEDKTELEKIEDKNITLNKIDDVSGEPKSPKDGKVYINLTALDKITAKTSSIKLAVGDKKFFGSLEIHALKCQLYEGKVGTWRGKSIRISAHQRAAARSKVSSLRDCSGTIEHWAAWRGG